MHALEMAARHDRGRVRENNQDVARVVPHLALGLVADGVGGHERGEVASQLAVDTVVATYERAGAAAGSVEAMATNVREAIRAANAEIGQRRAAERNSMATTLVVAAFGHDHVVIANVGDSRLYRLRGGHLGLLTDDHSLSAQLVREGFAGSIAERWEHVLLRVIDGDEATQVDLRVERFERDDVYLLCSDGLWGMLSDEAIARVLREAESAEDACLRLVRAAWVKGGVDNIAVSVICCAPRFKRVDPTLDTAEGELDHHAHPSA